MLSIVPAQCIG